MKVQGTVNANKDLRIFIIMTNSCLWMETDRIRTESTNEETYLQIRLSRALVFIIIISFPDSFGMTVFLSFCLRKRETNKAEEYADTEFPWVTYTAY